MMNYAGQCFELEQWFQPFGREATFLEHLRSLAEPWVDECWIDDYGSLIAHQRGDGKCVMVTAQADVQTVVITYIHEDGTARFLMTGKGSYHVTRGNAVRFAKQLVGVVEYDDDCQGASDWKRMRIRAENGKLSVGDRGILTDQTGGNLMEIYGPHCGVAAGCMVLLSMMQRERAKRLDIYYVFAIGSESDKVSQRGVKCAVYHIHPEVGISIESLTTNMNGIKLGCGPAILLRDEHSVLRKKMRVFCRMAAERLQTKVQYAAIPETERETALYHFHCAGSDAATVAIPVKPQGVCARKILISDLQDTITFLAALLRTLE